jgi:hypothetical protein
MGNARAMEVTRKLTKPGGLVDYGRDLSRLLVRVMRELAQGSHLPKNQRKLQRQPERVANKALPADRRSAPGERLNFVVSA